MSRAVPKSVAGFCLALLLAVFAFVAWPAVSWADDGADGEPVVASAAEGESGASVDGVNAQTPGKPAPTQQPQSASASEPVTQSAEPSNDPALAEPANGSETPAAGGAATPGSSEPATGDATTDNLSASPSDQPNDGPQTGDAAAEAGATPENPEVAPSMPEGAGDPGQAISPEPNAAAAALPRVAAKKAPDSTTPTVQDASNNPILAVGTYLFTWAKKTKYIVQSAKQSTKAKASAVLSKKTSILRQRWIVKYDEKTGYYTIVNEQTKKVLAVASKKNGANVLQAKAKTGSKKQLWRVVKKGSNYLFVPKANKRLALTGVKAKGGYNLIVRKLTKSKAQQFAMKQGGIVRNGVYKIALTRKTSKVLGVASSSTSDGASVKRGSYKGTQNQKFRITYCGGDLYTIEALHSGKFVGAQGSAIVQAADSKAASNRWSVHWNKKGVAFKNAQTGLRLNSEGTSSAVTGQKASKTKDQRWKLTKVDPKAMDPIVEKALAKAKKTGSSTNYFIAVDIKNHRTIVFKRSGKAWKVSKDWVCSTGAPGSPTPTGKWTVGIKGYSFGEGYTCYYYTQFWGDYLFHSVKYYQGTRTVKDGRLGQDVSEGCVRLAIKNAKWIYDYIPEGTRVVTYR